jgi:hypothetical protein
MQYLLLVYIDPALIEKVPPEQFDTQMRQCLLHADVMQREGRLKAFQQLESVDCAKAVRVRSGKTSVLDGPFAETKEVLAGFNLVEAGSMEEAVAMAQEFPWTRYGCIEVRPVRDVSQMRRRLGA